MIRRRRGAPVSSAWHAACLAPRMLPDAGGLERALLRLGHARSLARLGEHGPLQAAVGPGSAYAGALFGRDTLLMALDLLEDFPRVAEATLHALAAHQGRRVRKRSEEEPGRILHEHRYTDERRNPEWSYPYYGSVDATCLYVRLARRYVDKCGPAILSCVAEPQHGVRVTVGEATLRAVRWIERRLERNGFLDVLRTNPHGLANQVWPDSYDAFYFEDGRLFEPSIPYTPIGVQGYAYDALLMGAEITDDLSEARRWRARAARLRREVLKTFWLPNEGTFALALVFEPGKRPRASRVVASDAGHMLATGMLDGEDGEPYRDALRDRLFARDMLAGAGLRTKSIGAPRFNPGSYHNGSVWPMDNGTIADGLRRHGYTRDSDELEDRLLSAVATVGSPVEFFRGDTDGMVRVNTERHPVRILGKDRMVEQPPEQIQGWTATRVWRIMRRRGQLHG